MAKLPNATLVVIFNLQIQLLEQIDEATAVEFALFEHFGEEETIPELNEIRNIYRTSRHVLFSFF
ncbi:hypothetical protein [Gloeocapsopsis crepidinum]|uniref:hypothetical protein n=1 Tax=Gloeocapsopsis crepidinum TaxID=693223 RepID=UPI001D13DE00|nr:hypothetical protein [Gloeocapsopsis crepidinum]